MRSRSIFYALSLGVLVGALGTGSALYADNRQAPLEAGRGPFEIVDTPGSTYLLNSRTGEVWRLGFTEVKGDRYWFGTHVPIQAPQNFDEFQRTLRQRLGGQK